MKRKWELYLLILLPVIIFSCENDSISKRESEIDSIEKKSINILADIKSDIRVLQSLDKAYWNINLDSVQSEWNNIHSDSAELGLIYLEEFDSLYYSKKKEIQKAERKKRKKELAKLKKERDRLKRKFIYEKDEFKGVGFYTHKRWGKYWPRRKTLTSGVNSSGYAWLRSNYFSQDWIFHTSIHVLIGERKITSETVESYMDNNVHDNTSVGVWEIITFDNNRILKEVAENIDKTIKIRFNGDEFYSDATLSSGDKQALKDCFRLAELIKEIGND